MSYSEKARRELMCENPESGFGCMLESLASSGAALRSAVETSSLPSRDQLFGHQTDFRARSSRSPTPFRVPRPRANSDTTADVVVIGAGPTGLACAIEAQRAGFKIMAIDKGCVVNSLYQLSRQHVVLHHAGAAGDRRHSFQHRPAEAHARRGAGILPQGRRALSS